MNIVKDGVAVIFIFKEGSNVIEQWTAAPDLLGSLSHFYIPYFDHPIHKEFLEAKEKGMEFFTKTIPFEEKNRMFEWLFEYSDYKYFSDDAKKWLLECESFTRSDAFAKNSSIFIPSYTRQLLSENEIDTLKRFARVFEQAYVRFLDLQKAEAQAREAQIQLALERVRARTMAMQHSEELQDAAILLFQQLKNLGVHTGSCGFNIWDKEEKTATVWMSSAEGGLQAPFKLPHIESEIYQQAFKAMKNGEDFLVKEVAGEALKKHFDYLLRVPVIGDVIKNLRDTGYAFPEKMIYHFVYFNQGYLSFHTHEPVPEVHEIFRRFGKVFEQTYTRFLDLQKAEAQAREAKIEVALEKVRSRTMAMHKSDELMEVGELLWNQLTRLGIESLSSGYVLIDKEKKIGWIYAPNPATGKINDQIGVLHTETKEMRSVLSSWEKQEPLSIIEMDEQETIAHQTFIAERSLHFDGSILQWITAEQLIALSPKRLFLHNFNFKQGYLMIVGGNRLTEEQIELVLRFTKVFQQTYTRFVDLQKAEAQAREAIKAIFTRPCSWRNCIHAQR